MSFAAALHRARSLNAEFCLVKLAGEQEGYQAAVAALSPEQRAEMYRRMIQSQPSTPGGAPNTKPLEEWGGANKSWAGKASDWWNGNPQQKAALAARALHAKNPNALQGDVTNYMANGGMEQQIKGWGGTPGDGTFGGSFANGDGMSTYLPMGAGLLGMIGGAATNSPWIALLGALAAAYGGYQTYQSKQRLEDPTRWKTMTENIAEPQAPTGVGADTDRAVQQKYQADLAAAQAKRTNQATLRAETQRDAATVAPLRGVFGPSKPAAPAPTPPPAPSKPVAAVTPKPDLELGKAASARPELLKVAFGIAGSPDRGDLAASVQSHIDLYHMKQNITNDRELDPVSAGKLLAGIDFAERQIDSHQASVGAFGMAAAPMLGLAGAIALGSLFATSPQTQAEIANAAGGVVSGAMQLGVL